MGTHLENLRVKGQDEEVKNTPYSFRGGDGSEDSIARGAPPKTKNGLVQTLLKRISYGASLNKAWLSNTAWVSAGSESDI